MENLYSYFADTLGIPLRIEDLTSKRTGLSEREKNFIFSYLADGDKKAFKNSRQTYISNVIVIMDHFFQYEFTPRGQTVTDQNSS